MHTVQHISQHTLRVQIPQSDPYLGRILVVYHQYACTCVLQLHPSLALHLNLCTHISLDIHLYSGLRETLQEYYLKLQNPILG